VVLAVVAFAFVVLVAADAFGGSAHVAPEVIDGERSSGLVTNVYNPPSRPIEGALNRGDGQIFATQAVDPTVARPELLRSDDPGHDAYRWMRPMLGWTAWAASGGQPGVVPEVLVVLTVLSVLALVAVTARLIEREGGDWRAALLLLLVPGVLSNLRYVGPESAATACMLLGLLLWRHRDGPRWPAILAFAVGGLFREAVLVVPVVLAVQEQLAHQPWWRVRAQSLRLAASCLPFVLWILVLRLRLGSLPEAHGDLLTPVPGAGILDAASSWSLVDGLAALGVLGLAVAALVVGWRTRWAPMIGVLLAQALFTGDAPWMDHSEIGRALVPLCALSLVVLATVPGEVSTRRSAVAGAEAALR
jgi:hypothetical protein